MTELHLFAGAGGGILGGLLLGHTPVCAVEIDPYCQEVLRARQRDGMLPDFPIHGDITTFDGTPWRRGYLDGLVRTWYPIGDNPTQKELNMAGKLKKLTIDQAAECVKMYDAGLSCGDIAGYYGVSRNAMHDLLKRRTTMRPRERHGEDNHFYRGGVVADGRAHDIVEKAIKRGALIRPDACETCGGTGPIYGDGRSGIQAHHDDYNKPMAVRWLCQGCHHEWHKNNTPVEKEVQKELPAVDIVAGGFP